MSVDGSVDRIQFRCHYNQPFDKALFFCPAVDFFGTHYKFKIVIFSVIDINNSRSSNNTNSGDDVDDNNNNK